MKLEIRTTATPGRPPRLVLCDENGIALPGQIETAYSATADKAQIVVTFVLDIDGVKLVAKEAAKP